jgi:hypothetical protein
MSKKRNYKIKGIKPYLLKAEVLTADSDNHFPFIAGYTSGGTPFGLTWEEYNPNHEENMQGKPKRRIN